MSSAQTHICRRCLHSDHTLCQLPRARITREYGTTCAHGCIHTLTMTPYPPHLSKLSRVSTRFSRPQPPIITVSRPSFPGFPRICALYICTSAISVGSGLYAYSYRHMRAESRLLISVGCCTFDQCGGMGYDLIVSVGTVPCALSPSCPYEATTQLWGTSCAQWGRPRWRSPPTPRGRRRAAS